MEALLSKYLETLFDDNLISNHYQFLMAFVYIHNQRLIGIVIFKAL